MTDQWAKSEAEQIIADVKRYGDDALPIIEPRLRKIRLDGEIDQIIKRIREIGEKATMQKGQASC